MVDYLCICVSGTFLFSHFQGVLKWSYYVIYWNLQMPCHDCYHQQYIYHCLNPEWTCGCLDLTNLCQRWAWWLHINHLLGYYKRPNTGGHCFVEVVIMITGALWGMTRFTSLPLTHWFARRFDLPSLIGLFCKLKLASLFYSILAKKCLTFIINSLFICGHILQNLYYSIHNKSVVFKPSLSKIWTGVSCSRLPFSDRLF